MAKVRVWLRYGWVLGWVRVMVRVSVWVRIIDVFSVRVSV